MTLVTKSLFWWFYKCKESVANFSNLQPKQPVSNIRHLNRCILALVTVILATSLCWWLSWHPESVTNISNLSPTYSVSNIRHQHQCNLAFSALKCILSLKIEHFESSNFSFRSSFTIFCSCCKSKISFSISDDE